MSSTPAAPVLSKKQQKAAEFKAKKAKELKAAKGKGKAPALDDSFVGDEDDDEPSPPASEPEQTAKKDKKKKDKDIPTSDPPASSSSKVEPTPEAASPAEDDSEAKTPSTPSDGAPSKSLKANKGKSVVDEKKDKQPQKPKAKPRYILFVGSFPFQPPPPSIKTPSIQTLTDLQQLLLHCVELGNLPRQSTAPEIAAWFEEQVQVKPSVRLLTSKPAPGAPSSSGGKGESRGIAFIE